MTTRDRPLVLAPLTTCPGVDGWLHKSRRIRIANDGLGVGLLLDGLVVITDRCIDGC